MKKNVSQKFFFKKQFKNIHIFSAVNPLEKNEKKNFFSSLKFGNFFSKNKTLRSTLPHTLVP